MKGKKLLAMLLMCAVSATAVSATAFAGCGNNNGDKNKECTTHVDKDGDGKCDVCDKDMPGTEKPDPEKPDEPEQVVNSITLDRTVIKQLDVGYPETLVATVDPADAKITWTSSDPTVCTVESGILTGLKTGSVIITAKAGDKEATCSVRVYRGTVLKPTTEKEEVSEEKQGRTLYVSPTGSYSGDGTKEHPYDIQTLLDCDPNNPDGEYDNKDVMVFEGDTVILMGGEYNLRERIAIGFSGTYRNPITIKSEDPENRAVLKFYDMLFADKNRGVQINGNYFIWDSIDVCGAGDNGLYIGGSYNTIQNSRFYDNRDTGLQLGRSYSSLSYVHQWPSYNLIKNCTSFNNYDNETYGENADGFAAKLTVGYGNVFDGCIAYRNSDDGWDLYAKVDTGNIGAVIIYNCVAFENGYIMEPQEQFNAKFPLFDEKKTESNTNSYMTRDGDGNGLKLGGSIMEGEVFVYNCLTFNNRMHGVTDNSNPGVLVIDGVTSYNNAAGVDNNPYIALRNGERVKNVTITPQDNGSFVVTDSDGEVVTDVTVEANPEFGFIAYNENADECANVDVARQIYSYNHVSNTLSVIDGNKYCGSDAYRGTVSNSTLVKSDGTYYGIVGAEEYDTKKNNYGNKTNAVNVENVFNAVPDRNLGVSGIDFHTVYRNADGSINFGNILDQKNENSTQGADLNKTGWDAYKHYAHSDLTKFGSRQEATAQAIYDTLYLPIRTDACYQDFQAVAMMMDYVITWESSDPSLLSVSRFVNQSFSHSYVYNIEVLRPADADKEVTLTATINVGGVALKTKEFKVTVKKNTYKIGEVSVEGVVGDEIIIDQYSEYAIQTPQIVNGTSESGKLIDPSMYTVSYDYALATDSNSPFNQQRVFSAKTSGIWRVTANITLSNDALLGSGAEKTGKYEYYIYVASTTVSVDFAMTADNKSSAGFYVNKNGFTIFGQPSNPAGSLYVLASTESNVTAEKIIAEGEKREFKATTLSYDFVADNSRAYNIFYVFQNSVGDKLSDVHKLAVTTQDINSKEDFEAMLNSNSESVIYRLMKDIDCGGSIKATSTKFVGLFNGMGHTISNISIVNEDKELKSVGIFRTVENGTIMNVKFENISIVDNKSVTKTGIIGQMYGGYIYDVKVHNLKVAGSQRIGGIVGQVIAYEDRSATTYIDRVEVINDEEYIETPLNAEIYAKGRYYTKSGNTYTLSDDVYNPEEKYYERKVEISGDRSSAIVGFIQGGSATANNIVRISNCYSNAALSSGDYCGGIVGRSDDRNAKDDLLISNCYFTGVIYCTKRAGGILGGFSGAGTTKVAGCIGNCYMYYGTNFDRVFAAQKNCSQIVGNFSATADMTVSRCCAPFADYNSDYSVTYVTLDDITKIGDTYYWESWMNFDLSEVWEYVAESGASALTAPYIKLR